MPNLYENLSSLCKARDIKGAKMCADLGISKSLMTDLKSGRKKTVTAETAQKLADYFNVSVGYLLGTDSEKEKTVTTESDGLDAASMELVNMILQLNDQEKQMLLAQLKTLVEMRGR